MTGQAHSGDFCGFAPHPAAEPSRVTDRALLPSWKPGPGSHHWFAHSTSFGDVNLHAEYDETGNLAVLEVIRADPRILIGDHFLRQIARGEEILRCPRASVTAVETGGIFRIHADNGTFIWVLTEFEPLDRGHKVPGAWTGEWPD